MSVSRTDISDTAMPALADLRSADGRTSEAAWRHAYPHLWQTAQRLLAILLSGERHHQDREDIASHALAELVRGIVGVGPESFNQIASFGDLLDMTEVIVRARTKDFFRSRGRHPEDAMADPPGPSAEKSAPPAMFSWTELSALIGELPPPQPEIFQLHYADGRTAEEIATRMKMPRGTVLSHLFRGKKTLRTRLASASLDSSGSNHSPRS